MRLKRGKLKQNQCRGQHLIGVLVRILRSAPFTRSSRRHLGLKCRLLLPALFEVVAAESIPPISMSPQTFHFVFLFCKVCVFFILQTRKTCWAAGRRSRGVLPKPLIFKSTRRPPLIHKAVFSTIVTEVLFTEGPLRKVGREYRIFR
jgi:hypothetical protein